jgi:predicted phage gp36 major capsid-like protein
MEADEVKAAVDGLMTGWEEFKATNDARLAEIEKKGSADVLLGEKVDRIEKTLAGLEGVNQKLTRAELEAKRYKDKLDEIEVKLGRLPGARGNGADAKDEMKARVNAWVRAVVSAHTVGVVNLGEVERKALADTAAEYKALAITPDTSGGYLAPVEYVREILKGVTEMTPFRSAARVRTTAAKSIQIPKRTGQFAAQWVAERGTRSETTGLTYGLEELTAHEMFALVDITSQMLEENHQQSSGVWLRFYKKNSQKVSVVYAEALEEALCYGWIDSQTKSYDNESYLQKFTPRRSKSIWSKINTEHIERLIKEGKMKPAGMLQVEEAKKDDRWPCCCSGTYRGSPRSS